MKILKRTGDFHTFVKKGWGSEEWFENADEYCGKLLRVYGGKKTSLHFHSKKKETMYCHEGQFDILLIDSETGEKYIETLYPGDSILIEPNQIHQIIGIKYYNELFEFSTHHEDNDSFRIEKGD